MCNACMAHNGDPNGQWHVMVSSGTPGDSVQLLRPAPTQAAKPSTARVPEAAQPAQLDAQSQAQRRSGAHMHTCLTDCSWSRPTPPLLSCMLGLEQRQSGVASNVNHGRPGLAARAIDTGQAAALLISSRYSGAFDVMSQTYGQPCTIAHFSPPYLLYDMSASACLLRGSGSCAELTPGVPVGQQPATSLLTEFCLPSTRFKELTHSHHGRLPMLARCAVGSSTTGCFCRQLSAPACSNAQDADDCGASSPCLRPAETARVPALQWLTNLPCTSLEELVAPLVLSSQHSAQSACSSC